VARQLASAASAQTSGSAPTPVKRGIGATAPASGGGPASSQQKALAAAATVITCTPSIFGDFNGYQYNTIVFLGTWDYGGSVDCQSSDGTLVSMSFMQVDVDLLLNGAQYSRAPTDQCSGTGCNFAITGASAFCITCNGTWTVRMTSHLSLPPGFTWTNLGPGCRPAIINPTTDIVCVTEGSTTL
jgi:hypothetical protein